MDFVNYVLKEQYMINSLENVYPYVKITKYIQTNWKFVFVWMVMTELTEHVQNVKTVSNIHNNIVNVYLIVFQLNIMILDLTHVYARMDYI